MRNRYTHEMLDAEIADLQAQDPVFKVDVDHVKGTLSRVYENERDALMDVWISNYRDADRDGPESMVYHDLPFDLRHVYGKTFQKKIAAAPEGVMRTAIEAMAERMRPRHEAVQELIARQTKGRKPPQPKKVIATRTQLRAICACCFRQQAVNGANLVAHGYTLEYGFQNGTCHGAGKPHLGTPEGRDLCAKYAQQLREQAQEAYARAIRIETRQQPIYEKNWRTKEIGEIKNPMQHQIDSHAYSARREGEMCDKMAEEREDLVAHWKPAEPVEVEIEVTE